LSILAVRSRFSLQIQNVTGISSFPQCQKTGNWYPFPSVRVLSKYNPRSLDLKFLAELQVIIEWPLDCQVLDTSHWPDALDNLNTYGAKEIQVLKEHFRQLLHENGTNVDAIRGKWLDAKVGIHRCYRYLHLQFLRLWQRLHQERADECPNLLKLVKVVEVLPLERGFSCMVWITHL